VRPAQFTARNDQHSAVAGSCPLGQRQQADHSRSCHLEFDVRVYSGYKGGQHVTVRTLASQPTISRFENDVGVPALYVMGASSRRA
jgi:hypothetical protein